MKNKTTSKKLTLRRQTIQTLSSQTLRQVAGGLTSTASYTSCTCGCITRNTVCGCY
jgi:natural product precursor